MAGFKMPPGPIVGAVVMSLLAFTLIGVVVARSPYTHANLDPNGYNRTTVAYLGQEYVFEGLGLADQRLTRTGDPVQDGHSVFVQYGCASCHGLRAQGGVVGPELTDVSRSELKDEVRKGPKLMPPFPPELLGDEELTKIYAFLESLAGSAGSGD